MPELPEVETIRRALARGERGGPPLPGQTILAARVLWPRSVAAPHVAAFASRIAGQEIRTLARRGKYLQIHLSRDVLLVHLRMSGDLYLTPAASEAHRHHRVLLALSSGYSLAFEDSRKFGRMWLLDDPAPVLDKLGPEPLEAAFTPAWLWTALQARRRQLKPLLLDQTFLAGLGNIYTDEALHRARLHPLHIANTITPAETAALHAAIVHVLQEGIRHNGATIDWVYRGGGFQNTFQVYARAGQPCYTCGTPVVRLVIGQRGTHFCPLCQPAPPAG
ncbi:MAG: DNA-formamidopyrimidine glycosylase [Anaerolineales bacterium]